MANQVTDLFGGNEKFSNKIPRENRYFVGKIDGGKVFLTWTLDQGGFSMSGEIWNWQGTDLRSVGQNVEEIAAAFPGHARVQLMAEIWRRYHLNDMRAGSPDQELWLRAHEVEWEKAKARGEDYYAWASAGLAAARLNPDPNFIYVGEGAANVRQQGGYRYGSAWVREEIPAEVISEIETWAIQGQDPDPRGFGERHGITMRLESVDNNPNMTDGSFSRSAFHYRVKLRRGRQGMSLYFSQGSAHSKPPTLNDVLSCLALDAASIENAQSFDGWARELGLEEDSRRAWNAYQASRSQTDKLKAMLGDDLFRLLVWGEEPPKNVS